MSANRYLPGHADELRRAAYRVADAARQVEDLLSTTPASEATWADLRWAHALLSEALRLAPDLETGEPSTSVPLLLEAAGWRCLGNAWRRWVPPGSDGRPDDRLTQAEAWTALRAQAGQARAAAGTDRDAAPAGRHRPDQEEAA